MTTTADLGLPELSQAQANPDITHNEALILLQALLNGVIDNTHTVPPVSPSEGDAYLVAHGSPAPSGAWTGWSDHIAIYWGGSWRFVPGRDSSGSIIAMGARQHGLRVYVRALRQFYVWSGSPLAWSPLETADAGIASKVDKTGDIMSGALTIATTPALKIGTASTFLTSGLATLQNAAGVTTNAQLIGDGAAAAMEIRRYSADAAAPVFRFYKGRGSTASIGQTLAGDQIGAFSGVVYDDTLTARTAANFRFDALSNVLATNAEARFLLFLCASGSVSASEILRADHASGLSMFGANVVIDQNRLFRLRNYTVATLPSSPASGSVAYVTDTGGGAGQVTGDGTNWRRTRETGSATISTDAGHTFTWTYLSGAPVTRGNAVLTADRTVTLSTTGAVNGARARFVRLGAGAFNWNIAGATTKALGAANTYCEFEYDGTHWNLIGNGSL